jgi:hypothetical protein
MRPLTTCAFVILLLCPTAISAQEDGLPRAGDWSVAASLFTSDTGSVFGIGRMITDRLALGLELDLHGSDAEETVVSNFTSRGTATNSEHSIGPTAKWYGTRDTPVSPFVRAKIAFGWDDSELIIQDQQQQYSDAFVIQGSVALGAEWYPLRYLSVGGHAGLQWLRETVDSSANGISRDRTTTSWGTFRSGLELNYYFR